MKTKSNFESKICGWICSHVICICVCAVTLFAIMIRLINLDYQTWDYDNCLSPWVENMREMGGIQALGKVSIDYTEGYALLLAICASLPVNSLYFIKIISITCDFGTALFGMKIVNKLTNCKINGMLTYIILVMLPTVVINSSFWGQNDSVYTFFIIVSIWFAINEQYGFAMSFWAFSLSIKQTGLIFLPAYMLLYVTKKKFRIHNFLWVIITYLIISFPAILAGKRFGSIFSKLVGVSDTAMLGLLTSRFTNVYYLYINARQTNIELLMRMGKIWTVTIIGTIISIFIYKGYENCQNYVLTVFLSVSLVVVCFLPGMHERYGYFCDVTSIMWFMCSNKKKWMIPLIIEAVSLFCYTMEITASMPLQEDMFRMLNILVAFVFIFIVFYWIKMLISGEAFSEGEICQ